MPRANVAAAGIKGGISPEFGLASAGADERALLAETGAGQTAAFRVLLDRHLAGITAVARRMLRDDAEAEDVAQEAFLRLWRSGATLEVGPGGVRPWLRRVVSNLCIDRLRGANRQLVVEEVPEQIEEAGQLASLEQAELSARVDKALKALPERQRLALTHFHFEGMSQSEVAAAMDISDEAVESLLARARRALKAALKDEWTALKDDGGHG
jgi:RNA polymerase sigma-70 factor (ECF subfamily)